MSVATSSSVGTTFSMPVIATCTRGSVVVSRPLPSLVRQLGDAGLARQVVPVGEKIGHFLARLVDDWRDDVRGRLLRELQDVLAQVRLDDLDSGGLQRVVQRALFGHHGFRLDRLLHAMPPRDIEHDAIDLVGRFRPAHDRAARRRAALEFLQVQIEIGERALADRGGGVPYRLEVVELRDTLCAPADEIRLQLRERGLQVRVGELLARAGFEVNGGDLHSNALRIKVHCIPFDSALIMYSPLATITAAPTSTHVPGTSPHTR